MEECGAGIMDLEAGTIAAFKPGDPCGVCEQCRGGRYNTYTTITYLGSPPFHGAFREYLVGKRAQILPLPPGLTIDDGAMLRSGARSFHSSSTDQLRHLGLNQTRSKIFHLVGLLCRTHKQGEAALKLFETSYTLDPTPRRLAYFEKQKLQCISKKWVRLGPAEKATGLIRVVRAVIDLAHQHAFTILDRYVFRSLLPRRRSQR